MPKVLALSATLQLSLTMLTFNSPPLHNILQCRSGVLECPAVAVLHTIR